MSLFRDTRELTSALVVAGLKSCDLGAIRAASRAARFLLFGMPKTLMVHFNLFSKRLSCWLLAGLTALVATLNCSCAERYCQSGSNGTQCPTINEIEWQRTQQREEPWPAERSTEPAPGCVLSTPTGLVQRPYTANASGAPANLPSPYLMSGACVSRQQPVYGAVR